MIQVNAEEMEWEAGMTVQDVLERRKYTFPLIVVKVNGELVRKQDFGSCQVPDEAEVWVIHLISGG